MPIQVSIVEDNDQLRGTLARLINRAEGFACLSQYANAEAALEGLPKDRPQVVFTIVVSQAYAYKLRFLRLVVVLSFGIVCLLLGCGRNHNSSQDTSSQSGEHLDQDAYQRAKDEALARSAKAYEERVNHPQSNQFRLPNFETGPGQPQPIKTDFYETRDYYPSYLLCSYGINEDHYNQSNESEWFNAALLQIRTTGSNKFPSLKWVAVIILNRAEHHGVSMYEQAHKVGAVFNAQTVFNPGDNLQKLVVDTPVDWHPFQFDPDRPTPGERDRWLIVERHMATNHIMASPSP